MANSLLLALTHLVNNYIDDASNFTSPAEKIKIEMVKTGFHLTEIEEALAWFDDLDKFLLNLSGSYHSTSSNAVRIFTEDERNKITTDARGYITGLENDGILDAISREVVIDRLMALKEPLADITDVEWISLFVLFKQHERKQQLNQLEDLVINR